MTNSTEPTFWRAQAVGKGYSLLFQFSSRLLALHLDAVTHEWERVTTSDPDGPRVIKNGPE